MKQDREGYLWIGAGASLYRYDGAWFQEFGRAEGLPESPVRAIYEDAEGTLWVGTVQGVYHRAGPRFRSLPADRPVPVSGADSIHSRGGLLYVGSDAGLFVGEAKPGSRLRLVPSPPEARDSRVSSLEVDGEGVLWAICGQSLCTLRGGTLEAAGRRFGLPRAEWTALKRDSAGAWWVRNPREVWHRPAGAEAFSRWPEELPGSGAGGLALDPHGKLVVPTDAGVRFLSDQPVPWLREQEGLPRGSVSTVYWDRAGALWISLASNGLARVRGKGTWQHARIGHRLSSNTVTSIVRDAQGRLWAGTNSGLRCWRRGGSTWEEVSAFRNWAIRTLFADEAGGLWIGTARQGVYRLDLKSGAFRRFNAGQGLDNDAPIAFHRLGPGQIWLSTRGGVYEVPLKPPWRFTPVETPYSQDIYRFLLARDGTLWAAGRLGLSRRDGGGWRTYGRDIGLRDRELVFLSEGSDGAIWVGYGRPQGISRVRWSPSAAPQVEHFGAPWPLGSSDISILETDRRGWIWVGTDDGVSVFDGFAWSRLRPGDGLVSGDTVLNAFWQEADGGVLLGTNSGLARFRPQQCPRQADLPRVVFSSVESGGRPAEPGAAIRTFPLRFRFAAPLFENEREFQYRYRLAGSGGGWMETARGEAALEWLAPGSYRLDAAARRPFGRWSAPASLSFNVAAPWWSSWWLRGLALAAAALLGRAVWRWREQAHLARHRRLEEAVRQRTREIEAKREQIEALLIKANEANELKRQFLANISHELRTPMNGVLGLTELALAGPLTPEQRDHLTLAHQAGSSLLALLNDLLDLSRMETGRLAVERTPFPLRSTLQTVYDALEPTAAAKGLDFHLRWDPALPDWACGDALRLRQVLRNLAANAIKFTETGEVLIAAETHRAGAGPVAVRFLVRDTGIGIPVDRQAAIFDAFEQSDGSATRRFGGSGLGLSIAANLVRLMGGRIWVESAPGRGSAFSFVLPLQREQPRNGRHAETLRAAPPDPAAAPRILIVEDNPVNQKLANRLLAGWGYDTVVVSDGEDAVREWERQPFALILMDVHMPALSGTEATRRIRQQERRKGTRTPILGFTAAAMLEEQARCLEAGMDDCVTKPLRAEELRRQVARFAGAPAPEGESSANAPPPPPPGLSPPALPSLQSR